MRLVGPAVIDRVAQGLDLHRSNFLINYPVSSTSGWLDIRREQWLDSARVKEPITSAGVHGRCCARAARNINRIFYTGEPESRVRHSGP
jgi:hypothetical protein